MLAEGNISPDDVDLLHVTDSVDEAVAICVTAHHRQWTSARTDVPRREGAGCSRRVCLATAVLAVLALSLLPARAGARVAVVAGAGPEVLLVDVVSNDVTVRLPAPAGRAAAATPDGRRGIVAAGVAVLAVDLDRPKDVAQRSIAGPVRGLAAAQDGRIVAVGATTLTVLGGADPRHRPYGRPARRADRRGSPCPRRRAGGGRPARRARGDRRRGLRRCCAASRRRARAASRATGAGARGSPPAADGCCSFAAGERRAERNPIRLGAGLGGALDLSPDGTQLAVGAVRAGTLGAVVDLAARKVRRFRTGRGPGVPAWSAGREPPVPGRTRRHLAGLALLAAAHRHRLPARRARPRGPARARADLRHR
jgi:hypothetical protein